MSGLIWNFGNYAAIYAVDYLGYGIGVPMTQLSLLVSALWGVFLFREVTGKRRLSLFSAALALLVGGAILLGVYGGVPKITAATNIINTNTTTI